MLRVPFPEALGHQDFDGFTEQFLPGVAEDRLGLPVEADDAPLVAGDDDGVRRGLQHVAEFGLLTLHRGPLLLGNVPRDLRGPDDVAVGIADRGDGQRDIDDAAVFRASLRLVMVHPFAAADSLEDPPHVLNAFRRHQQRDVLPDDLLGRVAEDSLGPTIPAGDDPFERLADDGIVRRLDDGREQPPKLRLFPVRLSCHMAISSTSSSVIWALVRSYSFVVFADSVQAIGWAFSKAPPHCTSSE